MDKEARIADLEAQVVKLCEEVKALWARVGTVGLPAVTVNEAATRLKCGRRTVFKLLVTGELKRADGVGKETLVTTASIEKFQGTIAPRARPARKSTKVPAQYDARAADKDLTEYLASIGLGAA